MIYRLLLTSVDHPKKDLRVLFSLR